MKLVDDFFGFLQIKQSIVLNMKFIRYLGIFKVFGLVLNPLVVKCLENLLYYLINLQFSYFFVYEHSSNLNEMFFWELGNFKLKI